MKFLSSRVVLILLSSLLFKSEMPAQTLDSAGITKEIGPAVVSIRGTTDKGDLIGTGFIISTDGKIATNLHVIADLRRAGVELASGEKFDTFSVIAFDSRKDLAIIKIPGFDLPSLKLGNSNSLQVGEPVLVLGSSLGLQGSVTTGVVSAIRDDPFGGGFKVVQTDAPSNPGNSGGPLVNRQSEVVGIITFKVKGGENVNFAIPVNYLHGLMESPASTMTLDELRVKLSNSTDVFKSDDFPSRWKSLTTGTTKIVRRDGNRVYVETVLSEAEKNAGCFNISDLQQKGEVFTGMGRTNCVCQYTKGIGAYARSFTNRFHAEIQIEIIKLSPTRIEGRTLIPPKDSKLDCAKGVYTKPPSEWEAFAWIPE
jgi:S1-C subfamily serine protease